MLAFYSQHGHSPLDLARKKIEEKKDEGLTAEAEPLYKAVALLESSHKVFDFFLNSKDFSCLPKHMIGTCVIKMHRFTSFSFQKAVDRISR